MSFTKWIESYDSGYDAGLKRQQHMNPRFDPRFRDMASPHNQELGQRFDPKQRANTTVGEKQEDPMKCTLHACKKGPPKDNSPSAKLYGFMKKR